MTGCYTAKNLYQQTLMDLDPDAFGRTTGRGLYCRLKRYQPPVVHHHRPLAKYLVSFPSQKVALQR